MMSLATDYPVPSSSTDDFAALLDTELDSTSDTSPEAQDDDDDDDNYDSDVDRIKRRKVEVVESIVDSRSSNLHEEPEKALDASLKNDLCTHPGIIGGLCIQCGQKVDAQSGVAFGYIHKDLRLGSGEIARLCDKDLKHLISRSKLYLVLDLDHTLLNSTRYLDITPEEEYLRSQTDPLQDSLKGSLFRLDGMHMMTKLRPFVQTFLKEASRLFDMYIYTMGERAYAMEMAKILDPENVYFNSKVIAKGDCTQRHQKGLDVVLAQESAVLILDDTEQVWVKHKENLILMERYHFFASSCRQFGFSCQSLSQLKSDESEADGALATVLKVLKRVHNRFFDKMLRSVRKEILSGCKVVFSRVFPTKFQAENHHLWKMAEQLGATCSTEIDPTVTHVISTDAGTEKSRWALKEKKFLVHPRWIEATNYLWQKQPEGNFPVTQTKNPHGHDHPLSNQNSEALRHTQP
ncbi:hypothetical protein LguiA_033297 [Lonicera macranthoides]